MVRGSIDRAHREVRRCDQLYPRPRPRSLEERWRDRRDNIAVIEVMAGQLEPEYWKRLRERLERELSQDEVAIRAQEIRQL